MNNNVKIGLCLAGLVGGVFLVVKGIKMYKQSKTVKDDAEEKCLAQAEKFAQTLGSEKTRFISNYKSVMNAIKAVKDDQKRTDMVENFVGAIVIKNSPPKVPFYHQQIANWIALAKTKLLVHFQHLGCSDHLINKVVWIMDVLREDQNQMQKAG